VATEIVQRWESLFYDKARPLQVRLAAASALMRHDSEGARRFSLDTLDRCGPETAIGLGIRELLVTQGGPCDALCVLLWEGSSALRCAAADQLAEQQEPRAISELVGALGRHLAPPGANAPFCIAALAALTQLCPPGSQVAPRAALEAITHRLSGVRHAAAACLLAAGPVPALAPLLLGRLRSASGRTRFEGTEVVARLVPAADACAYLEQVLVEESDDLLCWLARYELAQLNAAHQQAA